MVSWHGDCCVWQLLNLSVLCPFLDKNLFIFFSFEDTQCDCLFANKMDLEIIDFMCSCNKPGWLVLFLVNYPGLAAPVPPIIPTKSLLSYCHPTPLNLTLNLGAGFLPQMKFLRRGSLRALALVQWPSPKLQLSVVCILPSLPLQVSPGNREHPLRTWVERVFPGSSSCTPPSHKMLSLALMRAEDHTQLTSWCHTGYHSGTC